MSMRTGGCSGRGGRTLQRLVLVMLTSRCSWCRLWALQASSCFFTWNSPALDEEWWEPFIAWLQTLEFLAGWSATLDMSTHAGVEGRIRLVRWMLRPLARCSWWLCRFSQRASSCLLTYNNAMMLVLRQRVVVRIPQQNSFHTCSGKWSSRTCPVAAGGRVLALMSLQLAMATLRMCDWNSHIGDSENLGVPIIGMTEFWAPYWVPLFLETTIFPSELGGL